MKKTPSIPEAKEGSIIASGGFTYYIDKDTNKIMRMALDGSKEEPPAMESKINKLDFKGKKIISFFDEENGTLYITPSPVLPYKALESFIESHKN